MPQNVHARLEPKLGFLIQHLLVQMIQMDVVAPQLNSNQEQMVIVTAVDSWQQLQ